MATNSDITTLTDLANLLLDTAGDCLADTTAGAPTLQYISPAAPAFDCCLIGSSMVSTEYGPVPISEVKEGDRVWAMQDDGSLTLRTVLRSISRGVQPVFRVRTPNRTVIGTAEHPFLRLVAEHGRGEPARWRREWIPVDELSRKDILVSLASLPTTENEPGTLPDGSILTEQIAWILGVWIGDGCFNNRNGFCLFVHGELRKKAIKAIREAWGLTAYENKERLEVNSRRIFSLLIEVLGREKAKDKKVPSIILRSNHKIKRAFLDGYREADGHVSVRRGSVEYAAASERLIAELRMLHIELGDHVCNLGVQKRNKAIIIKGKRVKNALPLHRFTVTPHLNNNGTTILDYSNARSAIPDKSLGVAVIAGIEPWGEQETFDLTIEHDENFIADGLVVHNCPALIVHVAALSEESTSPLSPIAATGHRDLYGRVTLATLVITALRCAPMPQQDGSVLTADIEAVAAEVQEDGWALWNCVGCAIKNEVFLDLCTIVHFDRAVAINEQGGCCGWQFVLRCEINQIPCGEPTT